MDFTQFVTAMQQLSVLTDVYGQQMFNSLLPRIIEYAELRCYRSPVLDFLSTRTSDVTQMTATGSRLVPIPDKFIVVENVNLLTPANATLVTPGYERVPLLRTSRAFVDGTWPQESSTKAPAPFETYWALYSMQEAPAATDDSDDPVIPNRIIISPTPDNQYTVEFLGTFRPEPLSEENPETFLTRHLPDLFISAAMVYVAGSLLKNYGSQADDPKMAVSWESVFSEQLQSAAIESLRQKSLVGGMSAYPPNPTEPNVAALQAAASRAAQ